MQETSLEIVIALLTFASNYRVPLLPQDKPHVQKFLEKLNLADHEGVYVPVVTSSHDLPSSVLRMSRPKSNKPRKGSIPERVLEK